METGEDPLTDPRMMQDRFESEIQRLKVENRHLTVQLGALHRNVEERTNEIRDLEARAGQSDLRGSPTSQTDQVRALRAQLVDSQRRFDQLWERSKSLQEYERLEAAYREAFNRNQGLQAELEECRELLRQAQRDIQRLGVQSPTSETSQEIAGLRRELQQMRTTVQERDARLNLLEMASEDRAHDEALHRLQETIRQRQDQLVNCLGENRELQRQIGQCKEALAAATGEIRKLEAANRELQDSLKRAKEEKRQLQQEIDGLRSAGQSDLGGGADDVSALRKQLDNLRRENELKVEEWKEIVEAQKKSMSRLQTGIDKCESELAKEQARNQGLTQEIQQRDKAMDNTRGAMKDAQDQIQKLQAALDDCHESLRQAQSENQRLVAANKRLEQQIGQCESELAKERSEILRLRQEIGQGEEYRKRALEQTRQLQSVIDEMTERFQRETVENMKLRNENGLLREKLKALEERALAETERCQKVLEKLTITMETNLKQRQAEENQLRDSLDNCTNALEKAKNENKGLQREIRTCETQLAATVREKQGCEEALRKAKNEKQVETEALRVDHVTLRRENGRLREELEALGERALAETERCQKDLEKLKQLYTTQLKKLEAILEETRGQKQQLEVEINRYIAALRETLSQKQQLEVEINRCIDALEETRAQNVELQKVIDGSQQPGSGPPRTDNKVPVFVAFNSPQQSQYRQHVVNILAKMENPTAKMEIVDDAKQLKDKKGVLLYVTFCPGPRLALTKTLLITFVELPDITVVFVILKVGVGAQLINIKDARTMCPELPETVLHFVFDSGEGPLIIGPENQQNRNAIKVNGESIKELQEIITKTYSNPDLGAAAGGAAGSSSYLRYHRLW